MNTSWTRTTEGKLGKNLNEPQSSTSLEDCRSSASDFIGIWSFEKISWYLHLFTLSRVFKEKNKGESLTLYFEFNLKKCYVLTEILNITSVLWSSPSNLVSIDLKVFNLYTYYVKLIKTN